MIIDKNMLDAGLTLMDSAQAFHWSVAQGRYGAVCSGEEITLTDCGDHWQIDGDEGLIRCYFDLDRQYEGLCDGLDWLKQAAEAVRLLPGLRMLQQDPWEALIAFICSANNNTARIRTLVKILCRDYGVCYTRGALEYCGFPSPQRLAQVSEEELREKSLAIARHISPKRRAWWRTAIPSGTHAHCRMTRRAGCS